MKLDICCIKIQNLVLLFRQVVDSILTDFLLLVSFKFLRSVSMVDIEFESFQILCCYILCSCKVSCNTPKFLLFCLRFPCQHIWIWKLSEMRFSYWWAWRVFSSGLNTVQLGGNQTVRRYIFRARDWAKKVNRRSRWQVDLKYMFFPISLKFNGLHGIMYMKTEFWLTLEILWK